MQKTVAIAQARQSSTRLPGKAMMKLGGKPVIERVVNRIKAVNVIAPLISKIVVAATDEKCDNPIDKWCQTNKVECYRGSRDDVLGRYYYCALNYKADYILRITADCPLIDPFMIYGLITKTPRKEYQALAFNRHAIPAGWDAELFSFDLLERTHKRITDPQKREHVTLAMRGNDEDNKDWGTDFNFQNLKYDLDTPEDLRRLEVLEKYL